DVCAPGVGMIVAVLNRGSTPSTATSSDPESRPRLMARPNLATWSPSGPRVHGMPGTCQHSPQLARRAAAQISASDRTYVTPALVIISGISGLRHPRGADLAEERKRRGRQDIRGDAQLVREPPGRLPQ